MKKGFTLIELLIVIAIIGVLAALLLPNIMDGAKKANVMKTVTLIDNIAFSLDNYRENIDPQGFYPEASEEEEGMGTSNLVDKLKDTFQFSDDQLSDDTPPQLVDGWMTPMRYIPWRGKPNSEKNDAHNKKTYDLWSAGENLEFDDPEDEEDNITNWSSKLEDEES